MSPSHALSQHSVTGKRNIYPAPARISLRVPAPAPQMRVPATQPGLTRPV